MRQPEGEALRRAVRWISQRREEEPERGLVALVDEAARRFNLTPKDEEYLLGFFRDVERRSGSA